MEPKSKTLPRLVHVAYSFGLGGAQARIVQLIERLGGEFQHVLVARNGDYEAASRIPASHGTVKLGAGHPVPRDLWGWRKYLASLKPDLLLTYNWGAIDAAAAARLHRLCPVIHTEDGFGAEEAKRIKRRRVWFRRLVLSGIYKTVVPSRTLLKIVLEQYRLPAHRVAWIPNGVDSERFCPGPRQQAREHLGLRKDWVWFGYVGGLREEKQLDLLVDAFHRSNTEATGLVLVGSGPEEQKLRQLVDRLGLEQRVVFAGPQERVERWYQALDVFVLASMTEQMPLSLLEAMATGLAAVVTDVGDCSLLLGTRQWPEVVPPGDPVAMARALRQLAQDSELRRTLGEKNRRRAIEHYPLERMVQTYRELYSEALRVGRFGP